jgi:hypothetical protein
MSLLLGGKVPCAKITYAMVNDAVYSINDVKPVGFEFQW